MSQSLLYTLPGEVIEAVLQNLDYVSLVQCCLVCRDMKVMIGESSELQYIIELGRDGLLNLQAKGLSYAERLVKLRDRREAWANLAWKSQSIMPISGLCHAYELVEGLFVNGAVGKDISLSWLPSATNEGHQIPHNPLDMPIRDFAIDPGQDLIVFLDDTSGPSARDGKNINLHIRTISTNQVHTNAGQPILNFTVPRNPFMGTLIQSIILVLAGDMLGVFLYTDSYRLLMWNWKEGILITDSHLRDHQLPNLAFDFIFINPRSYILTSRENSGSLQIFNLDATRLKPPVRVATLHLPKLAAGRAVRAAGIHAGPLNTPSPSQLFVRPPDSRIHVLCIQYAAYLSERSEYCVFIHQRVFIDHLALYASGEAAAGIQVPWDSWGPKNARFSAGDYPFTWMRYVHGQRVVLPQKLRPNIQGNTGPPKLLQVLDFGVQPNTTVLGSQVEKEVITGPSSISADRIFARDVVSYLPYCIMKREISDNYSTFMIDEDRIVGVKARGVGDEQLRELHVYSF